MIIDFQAYIRRDFKTKEYDVAELLRDMEENQIQKRVVTALEGRSIQAQNDFIVKLVQDYPRQLIGCAILNPKEDSCPAEAARILAAPEIKVLEFHSLEHGYRPEKLQFHIDPVLEICQERGILVKVFTGQGFYTMPEQWMFYSKRFPNLTFIIEHFGGSDFSYGTIDLVKSHENLMVTTSYETEMQPLKMAFGKLPEEKYLFGSNYPLNFTDLALMKYNILNLSQSQKEHLFYKNASRILKLIEELENKL
ncbi:MAG: amidohydrolase family protein [Anaerolineaceae bacterium]|nr:amidohydrolase family protein [Anaerolineaceae bacterium]